MTNSIGRIYYGSIDLQQLQLIDLTYTSKKKLSYKDWRIIKNGDQVLAKWPIIDLLTRFS